MSSVGARLAPLTLAATAFALLLGPAGAARAQTSIDIPFTEVIETASSGDRCSYRYYLQIAEVRGASSYSATNIFQGGRLVLNQSGPPFPDDDEQGEGYRWTAPKGTHRFGATAGSGPAPCAAGIKEAWEPKDVKAHFTDDKARIVGSATDADGTPVGGARISISGASSASAHTNTYGVYSVTAKKGRHQVRGPEGFCAAGIEKCTNVKTVNVTGTANVNFVRRNPPLIVSGTVRDEFRRGLGGVRMSLTGPEANTVVTDAAGRYQLRVGKPGTYELTGTPAGRPRGPNERYYIVRDGVATDGTAADVTLSKEVSPVTVDWELDRRLQFSLTTHDPARADGFSRAVATVRALTQRGDPAPGVELRIDPPTDAVPRAVICTTGAGSRPLWPSLNSDGSVSPVGLPVGPDTTTNAKGEVSFRVFPGTDPRPFTINGSRRTDDDRAFSSFSQTIPFVAAATGGNFSQQSLRAGLQQAGPRGTTFFGDQATVFELLAAGQVETNQLFGVDAAPVSSGDKRGIVFFPRGSPPAQTPDGGLVPSDGAFVLENTFLQRITGIPALPTLREWAAGQAVAVDRPDRRTFLGWPLPLTSNGGLGTCLRGTAGDTLVFAAHSPVRTLLTDGQGRRIGTDAAGRGYADAPGAAYRQGDSSYVVAPQGAYTLTVAGTGSGPVVLEARNGAATSVARFTARKGARVALKVSNGALPSKFRFAGKSVRSVAGVPLVVKGLPSRLRVGRKQKVTLTVTDAFGTTIPSAALSVSGATGSLTRFANSNGRIDATLRAAKKGRVTFVVSAPDLLPNRTQVKAGR